MPADMLASHDRFHIEVEHHGVVAGWIGPRGPAWMGHMAQSQRQAHELPAIGRVSYLRPISDSSQPAGQGWSGGAAGQGHGAAKDSGDARCGRMTTLYLPATLWSRARTWLISRVFGANAARRIVSLMPRLRS